MLTRRHLATLAASVALVTACSEGVHLVGRASDGPIEAPDFHGTIVRGQSGERFTDGFEVLRVAGDKPAIITSVRSVGADSTLKLLGAKIAGPDRKLGAWTYLPNWPPTKPALGPLVDAEGAHLLPRSEIDGKGYELLIGYELGEISEMSTRTRVEVDYTVDGKDYVFRSPAALTFCPDNNSDDECLDAAEKAGGVS